MRPVDILANARALSTSNEEAATSVRTKDGSLLRFIQRVRSRGRGRKIFGPRSQDQTIMVTVEEAGHNYCQQATGQ